jgi:hypothetical protein
MGAYRDNGINKARGDWRRTRAYDLKMDFFTLKPAQSNMKKWYSKTGLPVLFSCCTFSAAEAQLTLTGQLRTRTEFRDGQGAPLPSGGKPAFFTSQRSRLSAGYETYRLKFGLTVQDVRVWGQDVSTINRTTTQDNNGFLLHEAWAEILLTDSTSKKQTLSLKLGRQELVYDDVRLLGNLDWLQQARRHDAALLKFNSGQWTLHAGLAFNQNKENTSGTIYNSTPPGYAANTNGGTAYKSMQFLYAGKKLSAGNTSLLFFADQFSKFRMDNSLKVYETGSWSRFTTGLYYTNTFQRLNLTGAAYYQFGKNANGQKLRGELVSLAGQYALSKKFSAGLGYDYTSGGSSGSTSRAFDPLYGTPHKFWGYMDYFYVASGFGNKGLHDAYLKTKYKASDKLVLTADGHAFNSASQVLTGNNSNSLSRYLGTELDIVATYALTTIIGFEAGYSHFFGTSTLTSPNVKNVANAKNNSNWAYLSINIKPTFLVK